jgi:hypothetical protein
LHKLFCVNSKISLFKQTLIVKDKFFLYMLQVVFINYIREFVFYENKL